MNSNRRSVLSALLTLLTATVCGAFAADDAVDLRLNWQPGDTLQYHLSLRSEVRAGSERVTMRIEMPVELRVKGFQAGNPAGNDAAGSPLATAGDSALALGGRLLEVELKHGNTTTTFSGGGQNVRVLVSERTVEGYLNGRALAGAQLAELRRDMRDLQELLRTRAELVLTAHGRVVRVSGLERLNAEDQKELAMNFIEGLLLPDKPLKLGEQWVEQRTVRSMLPKEALRGNPALADQTVTVVHTLKAVGPWKDITVAEFVAPLKMRFDDIILDEKGTRASVEFDAVATTLIDVRRGNSVEETVKGTVRFRPKGRRDLPSVIVCEVSVGVTLTTLTTNPDLALSTTKD